MGQIEPTSRVRIGRTSVEVTRLGLGTASIGGMYRAVDDASAVNLIQTAWDMGIRYFDVAPLYGYGAGELRLGSGLAGRDRDSFVVSTKVGRLIRHLDDITPGADRDRQIVGGQEDGYYADIGDRRVVFDYSPDGVRRSIEESLSRLGVDRLDIALIHDPDNHWREAIDGAYPALDELRRQRVVRAIGVGMVQSQMLMKFAEFADPDVFLLAGRYTLLDHGALEGLMPMCLARGISIVAGGIMNSGILAQGLSGRYDWGAPPSWVVERAQRIENVCARHGVSLKAAAVQFPLAHPAVASILAGVRQSDHLREYATLLSEPLPPDLWDDLRVERLIHPGAPTPEMLGRLP